jgi:hypothetical protein
MVAQPPFFQATRGLRQGFPLSPLLYVIMAETLNRRLEQERISKNIPGLKITRGVKRINNSQFVDDTLLLGGASHVMAQRFKTILDQYELASGGLISKHKSQIFAWNVQAGTMARIAQILQFPFTTEWKYFKYLGTPISLKALPGEAWRSIIQKLKDQFEIWGATWLNPAGRVVLIKSVLSSLPIFQFSALHAPAGIKRELAKITRKFLWQGGKDNEKKFHMVKWEITCAPKENGGLGIRDPEKLNLALGAKVIWRIITGGKEWWKRALCIKYMNTNRKRCVDGIDPGKTGSPIWKLVRASIPLIQTRLNWDPGNGKKIKIWEDNYSESGILSKIPSLTQLNIG